MENARPPVHPSAAEKVRKLCPSKRTSVDPLAAHR